MTAQELRIGNLLFTGWAVQCRVLTISQTSIRCHVDNDLEDDMFNNDELYPIPLTEEWLLKFGFEYWEDNNYSIESLSGFLVDWKTGICQLRPKPLDSTNKINLYILYVHQLQNLYFALTGSELTI